MAVKVLLDSQIFDMQKFGGISRYFQEISKGNDTILRMESYGAPVQPSMKLNRRIQRKIKKIIFGTPPKPLVLRNQFYINKIKHSEFDIFHPTYYDNYFLEELNKPYVLTVYDMIHEKYAEYFGDSRDSINKFNLCQKAEKIIAISNSTKSDLIEIFNIPEDKIVVTYLGTDYMNIVGSMPEIDIKDKKYILFTGNRSIYKNFFTFLIAVSEILQNNSELFLICTGPEFNDIELRWLRDLNVENKVLSYFCKYDSELVYLYKNAECFVFPSLYEGFGIPLLEAFACNCPVVSSPGGSLKEIAGDAAVYFDPKNIKEMRNSINSVLTDTKLRNDLISAGTKRLEYFSWNKCRKETNLVYDNVVKNI